MKLRTLVKPLFWLSGLFVATTAASACAGSEETAAEPAGVTESTAPDASSTLPPSNPSTVGDSGSTTPGKQDCVAKPVACKTDSECQSMCIAVSGAVSCCDTKVEKCWNSKTATCEKAEDPDSGMPPIY